MGYQIRVHSVCMYTLIGVLLRRLVGGGPESMFGEETMTHLVLDEVIM